MTDLAFRAEGGHRADVLAGLVVDLLGDGLRQRLEALLVRGHRLARGLGRQVCVALHGVLLAVLDQLDGAAHQRPTHLFQHVDAPERRLTCHNTTMETLAS